MVPPAQTAPKRRRSVKRRTRHRQVLRRSAHARSTARQQPNMLNNSTAPSGTTPAIFQTTNHNHQPTQSGNLPRFIHTQGSSPRAQNILDDTSDPRLSEASPPEAGSTLASRLPLHPHPNPDDLPVTDLPCTATRSLWVPHPAKLLCTRAPLLRHIPTRTQRQVADTLPHE